MVPKPYHYTLSSDDIAQIESMGYRLSGGIAVPADFINAQFENFDLAALLQEINNIFQGLTTVAINKELDLKEILPELLFQYFSDNYYDEKTGLAISRRFEQRLGVKVVHHVFFRLPEIHRNKGIARKIFRASLQQYVNIGVRKILVHAALEDGGYVWAKNFFTASDRNEMRAILNKCKDLLNGRDYNIVNRIYINYYGKNIVGTAFPIQKWAELPFMEPILRGSSWHGAIDFHNTEQFSNFIAYVTG